MTMSGLVVKDKFIVGVSGGEFGIRGWVAAYDINSGKQVWKAYSMGPDEDIKLAPDFNQANPHYGRFGEGTKTWPGERWRNGGGSTWGWYAYDPELNLLYYSTGNPGTWNPTPRQGDNKWSMTIFASDPDTGMAKWAYQMTPWDAWDYDGINEHVLVDLTIDGQAGEGAGALRPQRLRLRAGSHERHGALGREVRAGDQLGQEHRSEDGATRWRIRPSAPSRAWTPRTSARRPWAARISSRSSYLAAHEADLRGHQQPVHELRRRRGAVHRRRAVRRRERADFPWSGRLPGRVHGVGSRRRQEGLGHQGAVPGLDRHAGHRQRRRLLRHDGRLVQGGEREERRAAVEGEAAVGLDRKPDHVPRAGQEAVRRDLLRNRRLVRASDRGQSLARGSARRARRGGRRLRVRPRQGDIRRRHAARLRAASKSDDRGSTESDLRSRQPVSSLHRCCNLHVCILCGTGRARRNGCRRTPVATTSSFASAAIPRICRSPTRSSKGSRTRLPRSSPPISARRRATRGGRISAVSSGTRSTRARATSFSASPKASTSCSGRSRITGRRTSSPIGRTAATASRRSMRRS